MISFEILIIKNEIGQVGKLGLVESRTVAR